MTSYRQPGTVLTDHVFAVPLDLSSRPGLPAPGGLEWACARFVHPRTPHCNGGSRRADRRGGRHGGRGQHAFLRTVDGQSLTGVAGGTVVTPPGWATATARFDVDATAGVSSLTVSRW
jgi:hypothetical protein